MIEQAQKNMLSETDLSHYNFSTTASHVNVSDLSITSPDDVKLIEKLSFSLTGGVLVVVGDEGVGKTTLLKAIAGTLPQNFQMAGKIQVVLPVYCGQFLDQEWFQTDTYEYLFKHSPADEFEQDNWNRYTEVAELFAQMNLDMELFFSEGRTVGQLSGGEIKKLQIAKALLSKTAVLLLDEPTNHLDLNTIQWLEKFVKNFDGSVVIVSHDETFIENVGTSVLYLQRQKGKSPLFRLSGNGYKQLIQQFESEAITTQKEADKFDKQQKRIKREIAEAKSQAESRYKNAKPQDAAEKGRVRRGMAKATQNITQRSTLILDQSERPETVTLDSGIVFPQLEDCILPNGKQVLDFSLPQLNAGLRVLAENISLSVSGPEHIVLIGQNGVGKTTLMRQIIQHLEQEQNQSIRLGYVPQTYSDEILKDQALSPTAILMNKGYSENQVKAILARLHFTAESMENSVAFLSGGQICKVLIANILLAKPNVLFLDEPTNNLYPLSNRGFRNFLKSYPGAEIIISHDRKIITEVATKVLELTNSGLRDVTNNFKQFN